MSNIKGLTIKLLEVQNRITKLQDEIMKLKQYKNQIELSLINELKRNNINQLDLNGRKLVICKDCNYTPLSYKFLEQQLNTIFPNENDKVKAMIKYIKNNRHKQYSQSLKFK